MSFIWIQRTLFTIAASSSNIFLIPIKNICVFLQVTRLASTDRLLLGQNSPSCHSASNGCRECERERMRRAYRRRMTPCTYLSRKFPTRSKRIDVIARFLFPIGIRDIIVNLFKCYHALAVFATFNLCYWIFYLSAERKTRAIKL